MARLAWDSDMTDHRLEAARAFYASLVASQSRASPDLRERLERAFALTPREHFLGAPPWSVLTNGLFGVTQTNDPIHLYQNVLVSIDRARGINNGEPYLHGQLIAALDPQRGERALHIGCGTGYYTAILATLIALHGEIIGYEIVPELAQAAMENLAPWENADVAIATGAGEKLPAADLIYVSAGSSRPADVWLDALNDGGRLVFPLLGAKGWGAALAVKRSGATFNAKIVGQVGFITCSGAYDEQEAAMVGEGLRNVRSGQSFILLRGESGDDAVVRGNGWRLAKRDPA